MISLFKFSYSLQTFLIVFIQLNYLYLKHRKYIDEMKSGASIVNIYFIKY